MTEDEYWERSMAVAVEMNMVTAMFGGASTPEAQEMISKRLKELLAISRALDEQAKPLIEARERRERLRRKVGLSSGDPVVDGALGSPLSNILRCVGIGILAGILTWALLQ